MRTNLIHSYSIRQAISSKLLELSETIQPTIFLRIFIKLLNKLDNMNVNNMNWIWMRRPHGIKWCSNRRFVLQTIVIFQKHRVELLVFEEVVTTSTSMVVSLSKCCVRWAVMFHTFVYINTQEKFYAGIYYTHTHKKKKKLTFFLGRDVLCLLCLAHLASSEKLVSLVTSAQRMSYKNTHRNVRTTIASIIKPPLLS